MIGEHHLVSASSHPDRTILSPESGSPTKVRVGACVVGHRIEAVDLLLLSAWCGLGAGLLEVAARVLGRTIDPAQRLYLVSRHFLWLGPLSNLLFFSGIGLVLSVAVKLSPRAAGWLSPRLICACATLPVL